MELFWDNLEKNLRKDLMELLKARAETHPLVEALPVPPPNGKDFALTISCAHKMDGDFQKQARYLKDLIRCLSSIYPIYGLFYYEVYKDLRRLHIHGIVRFDNETFGGKTLDKFQNELRKRCFYLINKRMPERGDRPDKLLQLKDIDNLEGWMMYCKKQQHIVSDKMGIKPFIQYPNKE